jgi:DNA-binding beta-propeller fold protein YncE
VAYVSARTDNAILAFDSKRLLTDPARALIGRIPVGDAPVGIAVLNDGERLAVTNSNRFGSGNAAASLIIIDTKKIGSSEGAIVGTAPGGVFPRELRITANRQILLLTNFGSKTLAVIDVARLPIEPRER